MSEKMLSRKMKTKFSKEKLEFLYGLRQCLKYTETDIDKSDENAILRFMREMSDGLDEVNDEEAVLENLFLFSFILADCMDVFLQKHKRQHFNIQAGNLFLVDFFSGVVSCGMFISACVQLIIIKSFFTRTLSWKVWRF